MSTVGSIEINTMGFLGGSVVKNPLANAGDTDLTPDLRRSHRSNQAHTQQLLSPSYATTEALAPRACSLQQEKPLQWEVCAPL